MRKLATLALMFLVVAFASLPALADAVSIPYTPSALADAQKEGKSIVVDVYADWCPTCQAQKPIMSELKRDPAAKDILFITVDFDKEKDFLRAHRVAYQSTIIVFKGSQELARSTAETNRDRLRSLVLSAAQ
jgi:thiol-disulfide isomerase/thioredoxin